jgi:hypothetical protein
MLKTVLKFIFSVLLLPLPILAKAEPVWKFNIISALASRPDVPADFCLHFSPDNFLGTWSNLQQSGTLSQNGIRIKFRSFQSDPENGLIFTKIHAQIFRTINSNRTWYTNWYIHLQQLTRYGVADGVWSTPDCKGRLVAQILNTTSTE